ncbi:LysR substrate-binding domain-containing protein [Cupriavidus agavae]|uniref:DNA-binding transcriptional LysR family regulator n=1 Tax=Cupriavidus agavae TaxID=1001822 RepID=A0A4Q7R7Q8_9BURK|nr:LysR substrate-binding domain-containing protein [Cupriavidus agavae]RZT28845.1 DNA-binding transcriptional LysR family regulator [Cupriavidus agavae]
MRQHQLRAFVQVAESGTIRAAARSLHLSQSALTKALRELEEDVGTELLVRSHKGVDFTAAGRVLLTNARLALASLERAREEIRLLQGGAGAHVSAAVTPLLALEILPRAWRAFTARQPDARLSLSEGFLADLIPRLIEGRLDFAIAIADPADLPPELTFEPLVEVGAVPAGRTAHPLAGATRWEELAEAQWTLNLSAGSQSETLLEWLAANRLPVPHRITACTSPTLMTELMRRTDAIGYCPTQLLADPLYSSGFQAFASLSPLPPPMQAGLIRLRAMPLGTSARMLAELFVDQLAR